MLDGFTGYDPDGGGFGVLRNFRVKNGRLIKREGFALQDTLDAPVRGVWYGDFHGENTLFVCAGSVLYKGLGAGRTAVGTIGTDSGRICMYCYLGTLYLLDGAEIYGCTASGFGAVEGYIPTVRIVTGPAQSRPYEEINRLTDKVRVEIPEAVNTIQYPLWGSVDSVVSVTSGGVEVGNSLSGSGRSTRISQSGGSTIPLTVVYRLADSGRRAALVKHLYAQAYSAAMDNSVFLYGGDDPARVLYSGWHDGGPDGTYFPLSNWFYVGDGSRPVTSLVRQYDRLMLFTTGAAYMIRDAGAVSENGYTRYVYPVYSLTPGLGCAGGGMTCQAEDSPVTVSSGGVYRWISSDRQGEKTAVLISRPAERLLTAEFITGGTAHVCRRWNEFWLACGGRVLAYDLTGGTWYLFDGIDADGFFEMEETCFWKGNRICAFSPALRTDDGAAIEAEAVTAPFDFGAPHLNKRLHHTFVTLDEGSAGMTLECLADDEAPRCFPLHGVPGCRETLRVHTALPRFGTLRLRIRSGADGPLTVTQLGMQYHYLGEVHRQERR